MAMKMIKFALVSALAVTCLNLLPQVVRAEKAATCKGTTTYFGSEFVFKSDAYICCTHQDWDTPLWVNYQQHSQCDSVGADISVACGRDTEVFEAPGKRNLTEDCHTHGLGSIDLIN